MLGGDNSIVSVMEIPVSVGSKRVRIPADLYYACLDGNLEWDENGNHFYGEVEDSVNLVPTVYLTRVPIRTANDVSAFVNKLLRYEITPSINGWKNNLLMCGAKLDSNTSAEIQSDLLYNQYIRNFWNGSKTKFFDNKIVSNSGQINYCSINADNLQLQLEQGYAILCL